MGEVKGLGVRAFGEVNEGLDECAQQAQNSCHQDLVYFYLCYYFILLSLILFYYLVTEIILSLFKKLYGVTYISSFGLQKESV